MAEVRRVRLTVLLGMMAALSGAVSAPVCGQQEYRGPVLLKLPASTRALALGNAFPLGTTDSDAVFYNAAFGDRLRGASAAVQRYGNDRHDSWVHSASAGMEWWGGGLAIGVRALDHGRASINGALPEGEADLTQPGTLSAERAATLAYARRVRGVRLGASGHLVQHRTAEQSQTMFAADVAAGMVIGPVNAGLAARNIGTTPLLVTLSAATGSRPVGPLDVVPAASITYEVDGDVVAGGGLELGYWPVPGRTFLLRVGARYGEADAAPLTAGAGFVGDRLILDYALVPYDGGTLSHRLGIRWQ